MAEWSYNDKDDWQKFLKPGEGKSQSPIDISDAVPTDLPELVFDYETVDLKPVYNGNSIQIDYPTGSKMIVDDKEYELKQYHFHTPCEHTVDGKVFPMAGHFVHVSKEGEIAVVGVIWQLGEAHPSLNKIWNILQGHKDGLKTNSMNFYPDSTGYYEYDGSLTTPPLTEGVRWRLFKESVSLSEEQLKKFESIMGSNSHDVQPRNGRVILSSNTNPDN